MKDTEYILSKEVASSAKSGIFIRVDAGKRDTTFTIKFVGLTDRFPL